MMKIFGEVAVVGRYLNALHWGKVQAKYGGHLALFFDELKRVNSKRGKHAS